MSLTSHPPCVCAGVCGHQASHQLWQAVFTHARLYPVSLCSLQAFACKRIAQMPVHHPHASGLILVPNAHSHRVGVGYPQACFWKQELQALLYLLSVLSSPWNLARTLKSPVLPQ